MQESLKMHNLTIKRKIKATLVSSDVTIKLLITFSSGFLIIYYESSSINWSLISNVSSEIVSTEIRVLLSLKSLDKQGYSLESIPLADLAALKNF